jgi:hypothetical protein
MVMMTVVMLMTARRRYHSDHKQDKQSDSFHNPSFPFSALDPRRFIVHKFAATSSLIT